MASRRVCLWRVIGVVLLAVIFMAYLRPDFMFDLANRLWLCM